MYQHEKYLYINLTRIDADRPRAWGCERLYDAV